MPSLYPICTTHFSFEVLGEDGALFYVLEDLRAEVILDEPNCEIHSVKRIFTELRTLRRDRTDTRRVYLAKDHPLYADIVRRIMTSGEELIPGDWKEDFRPDEYDPADRADADYAAHE